MIMSPVNPVFQGGRQANFNLNGRVFKGQDRIELSGYLYQI
jgi:hypothetical protein